MSELKQTALSTTITFILLLLNIVAMYILIEIQAQLFILCGLIGVIFICLLVKLVAEVIKNRLDL